MDENCGFEEISVADESVFIADSGDIFQCGKCKQNFFSLLDFISHKKQYPGEHQICYTLSEDSSVLRMPQQRNEVWIFKENNVEWMPRDESDTQTFQLSVAEVILENQSHIVPPASTIKTISHFECKTIHTLIPDSNNELDMSVSTFSCFACGECFESSNQLEMHSKIHIPTEVDAEKNVNSIETDLDTDINQHSTNCENITEENNYQCVICGRIFNTKCILKKHIFTHKVWPDGLTNTLPKDFSSISYSFVCPYCQLSFVLYTQLRSHLKEHKHQKVFKCIQSLCTATFVDLESLMSHVNNHDVNEYYCHICNSMFTSLEKISKHQLTHCPNKDIIKRVYQCTYCKASFKKRYHLKHHMETASHINKCKYCNKSFASERSLRKHLISHDESRSYKCDICNASFKLKHFLTSHLVTHSKDRLFSCNLCHKDFKRKDLLTRHIKQHQPEKRKQCPYKYQLGCKLEFTRTDKLNQHIKKHKTSNKNCENFNAK